VVGQGAGEGGGTEGACECASCVCVCVCCVCVRVCQREPPKLSHGSQTAAAARVAAAAARAWLPEGVGQLFSDSCCCVAVCLRTRVRGRLGWRTAGVRKTYLLNMHQYALTCKTRKTLNTYRTRAHACTHTHRHRGTEVVFYLPSFSSLSLLPLSNPSLSSLCLSLSLSVYLCLSLSLSVSFCISMSLSGPFLFLPLLQSLCPHSRNWMTPSGSGHYVLRTQRAASRAFPHEPGSG
jgi:hypothetical protein